jgi:hypothetical protein
MMKWHEHAWLNPLLALICFEKKDGPREFDKTFQELLKALKYLGIKTAVLVPFSKLSNDAVDAEAGKQRIDKLSRKLEKAGYNVSQFEFENVQNVIFDLLGHRVSVGFREW